MKKYFKLLLGISVFCFFFLDVCQAGPDKSLEDENRKFIKRIPAVHRSIFDYDFPGLRKKISVDFRGIELAYAIKFLAVEGDLNIIGSQGISGTVTLFIEDITVGEAFDKILSLYNLAFEVDGDLIQVLSNEEYKKKNGIDFYDERETVIYKLKYASASELAAMLENVKSAVGRIVYNENTNLLVLTDVSSKVREMEEIILESEDPTVTEVFSLQYATAEDIKEKITASLTPTVGQVDADERTNTLIVTDRPSRMKRISRLVQAFDQKSKEVFIEAKIVQVTLSDTYKWGVEWNRLLDNFMGRKNLTITPAANLPLGLSQYGKLSVSKTGSSNLEFVLEMLSSVGETKILSNPHIAVQDGDEASLNVITKQPYSQTTTTTTDAATTESVEYTFVDVGVKLNVTPEINDNGYIKMLIKPEVSSITSFFPDSASENRVPVVETSNAETTVLVKDGVTIIIAGMIKDSKTKSVNKVPFLGDVPLLGRLFKNVSDDVRRTETIVFLTPSIISGNSSYLLDRDKDKQRMGLRMNGSDEAFFETKKSDIDKIPEAPDKTSPAKEPFSTRNPGEDGDR